MGNSSIIRNIGETPIVCDKRRGEIIKDVRRSLNDLTKKDQQSKRKMLDPATIKKGDRLIYRDIGDYCRVVKDGHKATVKVCRTFGTNQFWVDIVWDPGTAQNDGLYRLRIFEREVDGVKPVKVGDKFCNCTSPFLVENEVAGNKFLYCRVCKKERVSQIVLEMEKNVEYILIMIGLALVSVPVAMWTDLSQLLESL